MTPSLTAHSPLIPRLPASLNCPFTMMMLQAEDSQKTMVWWRVLTSLSIFNILLWFWTYTTMRSVTSITADSDTDYDTSYLQTQLQLSGVYVLVCAYRSILPRIDLERYCLFDTPWSNVVLGRSAATIAEVSVLKNTFCNYLHYF